MKDGKMDDERWMMKEQQEKQGGEEEETKDQDLDNKTKKLDGDAFPCRHLHVQIFGQNPGEQSLWHVQTKLPKTMGGLRKSYSGSTAMNTAQHLIHEKGAKQHTNKRH